MVTFVFENFCLFKMNFMDKIKILLVEDDKMLCTVFDMFLKELGYECSVVQTGRDAIEKCKENLPHLILMDIHLRGGMSGIDAAKEILNNYDLPVIFISSDDSKETIQETKLPNTYNFLVKPLLKNALQEAINSAYEKHYQISIS